jgi:hypothetical protein
MELYSCDIEYPIPWHQNPEAYLHFAWCNAKITHGQDERSFRLKLEVSGQVWSNGEQKFKSPGIDRDRLVLGIVREDLKKLLTENGLSGIDDSVVKIDSKKCEKYSLKLGAIDIEPGKTFTIEVTRPFGFHSKSGE